MLASALRQGERIAEWRTSTGRIGAALAVVVLGSLACEPNRNADANRDGAVTPLDVALVAGCIGPDPAALAHCKTSDVDGDGDVDAADLALVEQRAGLALPALASSDPAAGATAVARTAWLRLDFAEPVEPRALDTLALACDGSPLPVLGHVLSLKRVVVNPSPDMPADASCVLAWAGPSGSESLAFETAEEGAPATVYYDRTDLSATAPFPDDYWLVPDPSTRTGHRVALAAPDREPDVVQLFTSLIQDTAQLDGFSPLALITAELSDAPDPASLPMTVEASADPLASVGLFDLTPGSETFGARIPFQLHIRNDDLPGQPTAHSLVAFPSIPLTPGGRYGFVVTRRALADPTRPFDPSPFLAAAAAPATAGEDAAVAAVREVAQDVLDAIAEGSPPIPAEDVALALRITIRDTGAIPSDLLAMKAQVLADAPPSVTVTTVRASTAVAGAWIATGTWQAPSWRSGAFLARDASGAPRITRRAAVPFTLALPSAAMTRQVPVVMYQHRNPGTANELETTSAHLIRAGFAVAGFTDPLNRAYADIAAQNTGIFGTLFSGGRVPDLWVQTYGEQLAFLRALETLAARDWLPRNAPDGIRELDLSRPLGYLGLSNGASLGQAFLAYAPEVRAAALVAGSARFAELLFLQDETDPFDFGYDNLLRFIALQVPNVRAPEVWAGLSIFQMIYDVQDPQNHAAHLHANPIAVAGTTRKASLLVVEGVPDTFNPANAIRSLAWTAGPLPQLAPALYAVPYLEQRTESVQGNLGADATGALVQFSDTGAWSWGPVGVEPPAQSQQVAFLRSALGSAAPVLYASDLDSDGDGLTNVAEISRGSDIDLPDSDGDGLADGLEVEAGLDPTNPGDAGADPDSDGLTNAEEIANGTRMAWSDTDFDALLDGAEVASGTNPLRADSDGGGRKDGQEVNVDSTDPLDRFDDVPLALLPMDFFDGEGFAWNLDAYGRVQSRAMHSDGLFQASVGSSYFGGTSTAPTEDGGRELRYGPTMSGPLRLSRKIYIPIDAGFIRLLNRVENTGPDPVATTLRMSSRFYSGNPVVATSSGDTSADATDDYVVHDPVQGPPIAHVFSSPGATLEPSSVTASDTSFASEFPIVVPPYGAVAILSFGLHRAGIDEAVAVARSLVAGEGGALAGMSSAERREIANFATAPDADHDGMLDFDEIALGTDPSDPDSDGDGLLDGFEYDYGFDPRTAGDEHLDPDGDGADNAIEQAIGTNPLTQDYDGDGLLDGGEVAHGTDARQVDTDRDGLRDGQEVSLGTDPLDAAGDADADGLTDVHEVLNYRSDPRDVDTDGDGIDDGVEVEIGLIPTVADAHADADADGLDNAGELELGTDIWNPDSDADELLDGDEVARGADPLRPDTDGGGRSDGTEVWRDRSDPLDAGDEHQVLALPFDFVDGSGRLWTIDADGMLASDAWSSIGYPLLFWSGAHATKAPAEHRVVLSWPLGQREVHYPPEAAFVRILDVARNGPNDAYVYIAEFDAMHRSGVATEYVATSSGGSNFALDDDWVVLDDADGSGIPAAVIVREGEGSTLRHEWSYGFGAELGFLFWLEPDPGERAIAMTFLAQSETRAEALAIATTLHDLGGVALDGLDAATRAAIVNFSVPPP